MDFERSLDAELVDKAVFGPRFASLARSDLDLATVATWDRKLDRDRRILIPVDVQALQVPRGQSEPLVAVTGAGTDPEPFSVGEPGRVGIHVHWAMPDALLRASDATPGGTLDLPALPDRWSVLRLLFPNGSSRPHVRGWVIDAKQGSVTPLSTYDGTPDDDGTRPNLDPLDGKAGGSLTWTASYRASEGRFGFHDPLDDLAEVADKVAPEGFHSRSATYVVAGWMSTRVEDPLAHTFESTLSDALARLGWSLDHEADETVHAGVDPQLSAIQNVEPTVSPASTPRVEIVDGTDRVLFDHADLSPTASAPLFDFDRLVVAPKGPRHSTLFHGFISGVPITGDRSTVDDRPGPDDLKVAVGLDTDDIVAALGSETLDITDRRSAELVAAAFTSDLIDRLGQPDGYRDIAEREHADTFWSLPGKPLPQAEPDHLLSGDRSSSGPSSLRRKRRDPGLDKPDKLDPRLSWSGKVATDASPTAQAPSKLVFGDESTTKPSDASETREVVRPAPRIFRPQAPVLAIQGARPNARHHNDGLDDDGQLFCRYPSQVVTGIDGVVSGSELIPSLGSGAIPKEVLDVAREGALLSPHISAWIAATAAATDDSGVLGRIQAEMLRLYSADGRYDGMGVNTIAAAGMARAGADSQAVAGSSWDSVSTVASLGQTQIAALLAKGSLLIGTPPSPVAVTTWRQPWVPLFVEWQVELAGTTDLEGWRLADLDFVPAAGDRSTDAFSFAGRSIVGRGLAKALHSSIDRWIGEEEQRDATNEGELAPSDQAALERLGDFLAPLDLVSASLDGIREQLLGIDFVGGLSSPPGQDDRPRADKLPTPLFGGTIRLSALRLVDAFGRTLDVPIDEVTKPSHLEVEGSEASIRVPPRLQHGARWLFRLVDRTHRRDPATARHAFVHQARPTLGVNPVAGFLLPDHIDEALEMFDGAGSPLGQLSHHEITGAVRWEPAPGRPIAPGSGPQADLAPHAHAVGRLATGAVRADVVDRNSDDPNADSSLTALLRAIDTTLWTIDTFGALGTPSVAGLVGRPIAVVRATLTLDVPDDVDELVITEASGPNGRKARFDAIDQVGFPVRLGDVHRSDDSLLGFFVDDDFDRFHLIDRQVAATARDVGRHRGQLGLLGTVRTPEIVSVDHDYIDTEDTLLLRPGQVVGLTLLMLPTGIVHLTSGVLPRKQLRLADDWVTPGLKRLVPSVRVGPLLVDPEEIRLPKVNLLGDKQQFTRRTGPLTWRDDPIVAASQSALLPRLPHEIQEGWIRIVDGETDA